jgi:predicted AlkP superfamily pyrophosphatase or phosphodiesterase
MSPARTRSERLFFFFAALLSGALAEGAQKASHVVVFGIDGLSPSGIEKAATPMMHGLMARGLWTLRARAVIPTVSSPNWAAMIMGAAPDFTGVTSNEWQPDKHKIPAFCNDGSGHPPTIFGVVRKAQADTKTALFTDWPDFARLIEPLTASKIFIKNGDAPEVVAEAVRYLVTERPRLTFIHVDDVDHAGHTFGWETPEYLRAIEQTDELLGLVLRALDESGLRADAIVLVTADHGGHQRKHGAMMLQDVEIPWIASGPGLPENGEVRTPVSTTQTAPTIAQWLGLAPHDCWLAHPVDARSSY